MSAFSTEEKEVIRRSDLKLIEELSSKSKRRLSYLGLPSPMMQDIIAWQIYLGEIYAVEKQKQYISHLMDTAFNAGVASITKYFLGDINEIFDKGHDVYGKSTSEIFPIDIINLDYCHGLDYQQFKKLSTIESIIKHQQQALLLEKQASFPYFLLLLTHNVPKNEGNPHEKIKYLEHLTKVNKYYEPDIKNQIIEYKKWYLSDKCPASYLHKCFVIGKVLDFAKTKGFKLKPISTVQYSGDKEAIMMHYQFKLIPINLNSQVPIDSKISVIDILKHPVCNMAGMDIASDKPIVYKST